MSAKLVAGMDEAGRGSLISRVYVGIVVLPENFMEMCQEHGIVIRDSKKMTKLQRNKSRIFIENHSIDYNVQYSEQEEIDRVGILRATMNAMHRCVDRLHLPIDELLVDGDYYENHNHEISYRCIVRGDNIFPEIACASILAKTHRDEFIENLFQEYQDILQVYGIDRNKGYGTKIHMDAIDSFGMTEFHRKSFCKKKFLSFQK
jgi:ribonuclease HII